MFRTVLLNDTFLLFGGVVSSDDFETVKDELIFHMVASLLSVLFWKVESEPMGWQICQLSINTCRKSE